MVSDISMTRLARVTNSGSGAKRFRGSSTQPTKSCVENAKRNNDRELSSKCKVRSKMANPNRKSDISDLAAQISNFGFWILDFKLRMSCLSFEI